MSRTARASRDVVSCAQSRRRANADFSGSKATNISIPFRGAVRGAERIAGRTRSARGGLAMGKSAPTYKAHGPLLCNWPLPQPVAATSCRNHPTGRSTSYLRRKRSLTPSADAFVAAALTAIPSGPTKQRSNSGSACNQRPVVEVARTKNARKLTTTRILPNICACPPLLARTRLNTRGVGRLGISC